MDVDEEPATTSASLTDELLAQTVDSILESANLDELKVAALRRECEEKLTLSSGFLDSKLYKKKIRNMINDFLAKQDEMNDINDAKEESDMLDSHINDTDPINEVDDMFDDDLNLSNPKTCNNNNNNNHQNENSPGVAGQSPSGKKTQKSSKDRSTKSAKKSAKSKKKRNNKKHSSRNSSGALLDIDTSYKDSFHIYEANGIKHCIMLNQTDVNFGERGHNKFYALQLLEHTSGNYYKFVCKWGRVGYKGQNSVSDFDALAPALADFKKKFRSKTRNDWGTPRFVPVDGKYIPIDVATGSSHADGADGADGAEDDARASGSEDEEEVETVASRLQPQLARMLKLIFSRQLARDTLRSFEVDTQRCPLGALSNKQIERGFKILSQISDALRAGPNDVKKIGRLSSQFFTLIPHDFGFQRPPLLNSAHKIHKKIELLRSLSEMNITNSILKKRSQTKNALDVHYDALHCNLYSLDRDDINYYNIKKAVAGTHASTHDKYDLDVVDVFRVQRAGEKMRYLPFEHAKVLCDGGARGARRKANGARGENINSEEADLDLDLEEEDLDLELNEERTDSDAKMLLWHGSRLSNFVGILSQGLRIAPPEVPNTGYMFGKGIYFADCASKSANYIHATPEHPYGLLILSKVFLGRRHELMKAEYMDKAPKGFHSVKGVGKMVPSGGDENVYVADDGYKLCLGPLGQNADETVQNNSKLKYNEYIVYDVAQVEMKYLVLVNFKFKNNEAE